MLLLLNQSTRSIMTRILVVATVMWLVVVCLVSVAPSEDAGLVVPPGSTVVDVPVDGAANVARNSVAKGTITNLKGDEPMAKAVHYDDAVEEEAYAPDFSSDLPIFEPTNEWKRVLPGQHIPGGLDVQMNIQTGEKLARLPQGDGATSEGESADDSQKAEERFKETINQMTPEELQQLMDTFMPKPTENLQAALDMMIYPNATVEEKLEAMDILSELVDDVDLAADFILMEGVKYMIAAIYDPDIRVREGALRTITSAVRNHKEVQHKCVSEGMIPVLIQLIRGEPLPRLDQEATDAAENPPQTLRVRVRALTALTGLLRLNWEAQGMIPSDVITYFRNLINPTSGETFHPELARRVITFVGDLIVELEEEEAAQNPRALGHAIIGSPQWCASVHSLIKELGSEAVAEMGQGEDRNKIDWDFVEKIFDSIKLLQPSCASTWNSDVVTYNAALSHLTERVRELVVISKADEEALWSSEYLESFLPLLEEMRLDSQ